MEQATGAKRKRVERVTMRVPTSLALEGKDILVTGAAGGIGSITARLLS